MTSPRQYYISRSYVEERVLRLLALLPLALLAAVPTLAQAPTPGIVSAIGYSNGTPLTAHTSAAFNSTGASTLVAFVSSHPSWAGQAVSISGLSDNLGNTWNVLTGPTVFSGSTFTLQSAIYYVNGPATSATHTITVQLSNPAPLVFHVFAVSGSDTSGPPIFSAIADPGAGLTSASVITAPIIVPTNSLLLSWAKNETSANATALNGYTLDTQSTSFLWAESQSPIGAGSYTGDFQYDSAIGWQTAIVGLQPSTAPVAFGQAVTTDQDTPVDITLTATSPKGLPLTYSVLTGPTHGTLTGSAPNLTYTPNTSYVGPDAFTFRTNDGTANSNIATVNITVHGLAPVLVGTIGYINGTPLTGHTSTPFNSSGASTLVAFVSTNTPWNGLPVSISGLSDNLGNTWNVLTGPTVFSGSTFTLQSAIYYVNGPATSATHTITVQLSNPAPLVFHVFAVSGSDTSGPPIFSAIADPGAGLTSASVITAPIIVPTNSLLLSWAKNETSANATALNGYTLDTQSTSFLWAESQSPIGAGSYTGDFQYDSAIGWQTAIVGVKPHTTAPPSPAITSTPANPANQTSASFSFTDSQAGVSFKCQLDGSGFSDCLSPATYSGLGEGNHTFSVNAQDAEGNQSAAGSFTWTIDTTAPPTPVIASRPADPTSQTGASFNFSDTEVGISFLCQLDGSAFSACSNPKTYFGLTQGSHTFAVEAQDTAGNQSTAASFTWTIDTTAPPTPVITSHPAKPTNQTSASFSFSDTEVGVSFLCRLDTATPSACASPITYPGPLSEGTHSFLVRAQDAAGNRSTVAGFTWTVDTTAPPTPVIASTPANPTNKTTASFSFSDTQSGVKALCQLDGSAFSACSNPKTYFGLTQGSHTFAVEAQDTAGNQSTAASFTWTIDTTAPPTPVITSHPAKPTNQTSASFSFSDTEVGVSFLCRLDTATPSACASPITYPGPLSEGTHSFLVRAQDAAGNRSTVAGFTWTVDTTAPPTPVIASTPANPTNKTTASFSFSDTQSGVKALCQLDGSAFSACSNPKTYFGLTQGSHTFAVEAQDTAGNQSTAASFTWTIIQ